MTTNPSNEVDLGGLVTPELQPDLDLAKSVTEAPNKPHCVSCHTVHQLIEYNKGRPRKSDGYRRQYYICKPCNTARQQFYRSTTKGQQAHERINQSRRIKYIDKNIGFEIKEAP